jgi:hypothetical protein
VVGAGEPRLTRWLPDIAVQRINGAWGNAPEGAAKWGTKRSLAKAANDRVFITRASASK